MGGVTHNGNRRGEIHNQKRAKQLVRFSGLKYGTITFTDIDGFAEFGDKLFVWVELKHEGAEMPVGQRLALERVATAVEESGRPAYVLLATHDEPPSNDIYMARCKVVRVFRRGKWHDKDGTKTVEDAVNAIRERHINLA